MAVNPQISTDLSIAPAQPVFYGDKSEANATAKPMRQGVAQAQRDDVRQAQDAIAGMGGMQNLQFPHDAPKYWMGITLSEYAWSMGNGGGVINTGNVLGAIRLPIPTQLEDVQRVEYDQTFKFGPLWGGLTSAAVGLAGGDASAWDTAQRVGETAGAAVMDGARQVPGLGTAAGGAQAYTGLAPNQFFTVLLKGPQFKTYSLDFVLQPRTPAESATIRDIIQVLRWAAAPDLTAGGALWKFPTVVVPTFVPQGNGNETYMYRFKPAVMTDVGAAYNPFGPPSFYRGTGAPESVRLTIHFLELEYWLKRDF
jgi:hypothetical protein